MFVLVVVRCVVFYLIVCLFIYFVCGVFGIANNSIGYSAVPNKVFQSIKTAEDRQKTFPGTFLQKV